MRIWSLHPSYLDSKGLVALWRETLLAQNVLAGKTKGYKNHPQLNRFKALNDPLSAISNYLEGILAESKSRGYHFDASKILPHSTPEAMTVTSGQVQYERQHLLGKLKARDPDRHTSFIQIIQPSLHPLFKEIEGKIEPWEIT